jgi:hypothetical protein
VERKNSAWETITTHYKQSARKYHNTHGPAVEKIMGQYKTKVSNLISVFTVVSENAQKIRKLYLKHLKQGKGTK